MANHGRVVGEPEQLQDATFHLRSGSSFTVRCVNVKTKRNPMTGRLAEWEITYPGPDGSNAERRILTLDPNDIEAITYVELPPGRDA